MSARALLDLRGLPSILSLFLKEFNKFNKTGTCMLNSIYLMTYSLKSHFGVKTPLFCHLLLSHIMDGITLRTNL